MAPGPSIHRWHSARYLLFRRAAMGWARRGTDAPSSRVSYPHHTSRFLIRHNVALPAKHPSSVNAATKMRRMDRLLSPSDILRSVEGGGKGRTQTPLTRHVCCCGKLVQRTVLAWKGTRSDLKFSSAYGLTLGRCGRRGTRSNTSLESGVGRISMTCSGSVAFGVGLR